MKTWAKLIVLSIILAACLPAHGEVLIYTKTIKCWNAGEVGDDSWDIDEVTMRGYLVLDVNYPDVTIINSMQFEYWRDGGNKWLIEFEHEFDFNRAIDGRVTEWLFVEEDKTDSDTDLLILRGKAREYDIGSSENREVPKQLTGYRLVSLDDGDIIRVCQWNLRLQGSWTRLTNDFDISFDDAVNELERVLVQQKGYDWF